MRPAEFATPAFSRRNFLRGSAGFAAGAAFLGSPAAFAQGNAGKQLWPSVAKLVDDHVGSGKLVNMVATMGFGQKAPTMIARGVQTRGQSANAGMESLYRIYSMTKPVTGMATMMLVDDGKLGLDQPLAEILPAFSEMRVLKNANGPLGDTEAANSPITIRQLLTHTAGLGYQIVQSGPIKTAYEDNGILPGQVSRIPIPGFDRGRPAPSLKVFADRLATLPLVYQPGTRWSYSVGIDLLGRVIEVASGKAFDTFLAERIFEPAGMDSTWFQVPASEKSRLTTNYGVMGSTLIPIDPAVASIYLDKPNFPYGGAGLVSSPRDYDRFLRMLLGLGSIDGKRVMSETAVRLGTSNLLPEGASTKGTWVEGQGFGAGGRVGLGAQEGTYGWAGAAGTFAFINYKADLRAALYTQYMPSDAYPLQSAFPEAVVKDLTAMATAAAA